MDSPVAIRLARPSDLRRLGAIERSADTTYRDHFGAGAVPALELPPTPGADRAGTGLLLVAAEGRTLVGFAHVVDHDGFAHLEQLAVHRDHQKRGIGRRLLGAAEEEARWSGHDVMTLTTYRDVPWNAPFYASAGYVESEPTEHYQRRLLAHERVLGLEVGGPRVLMRKRLERS